MRSPLTDYFRCPAQYARVERKGNLSTVSGYFRLGEDCTCFGGYAGDQPAETASEQLHDATRDIIVDNGTVYLPFDLSEVVDNLRAELYVSDWRAKMPVSILAKMYYSVRPILPVGVRRHLQRVHLNMRGQFAFPRWPVDFSVDNLFRHLMLFALRANGAERIPFIWFWPEGAPSCAIMTHDVETRSGRDFCSTLMAIDNSFGFNASYQIIPEERYTVSSEFLNSIRKGGCEIAVHDLNHDGHLYRAREQFLQRVAKINSYGKQYGADGFRGAVLYRKQVWYDALKFAYDMSVPNVAHWDPQRGGCCTIMPYFLGGILEIPVTTTQDYTLFHILNDYTMELWTQQIASIGEKNGLISFIVHPDYIANRRERELYESLLGHLAKLREEHGMWTPTPREVNHWWRQRAQMRLVERNGNWQIEGAGKERARIAYAIEKDGELCFTV